MNDQGRLFKTCRGILRWSGIAKYDTPPRESFPEPAVYICRHGNLKGPILSMVNFPIAVHPWSFYVFCERKTCRKHCAEYTFSVRFRWRKWVSELVAWLIAPAFSCLIRSAGCIPVYRNSLRVRTTYRLSVDALKRGGSLLIFPDVNYTTQEGDAGKLYKGFLLLEQLYFRETGKHLPFVPMHISDEARKLVLGETVFFREGVPYVEDKSRVLKELHDAMNTLMEENGI